MKRSQTSAAPVNAFSIVALAAAIPIPIMGIGFGIVSLFTLRRTQERGRWFAIAGIVVGALTNLAAIAWVIWLKYSEELLCADTVHYECGVRQAWWVQPSGMAAFTAAAVVVTLIWATLVARRSASGHAPATSEGLERARATRVNGFAIAALATSPALGILGIVFGITALMQIHIAPQRGRGMAIAGVVLGALVTAVSIRWFLALGAL